MKIWHWLAAAYLCLACWPGAAAETLSIAALTTEPQLSQLRLSPSGESYALVLRQNGGEMVLVRRRAEAKFTPVYRTEGSSFQIAWIDWLDEERLLLSREFGGGDDPKDYAQSELLIVGAKGEGQLVNLYGGKGLAVSWTNRRGHRIDGPLTDPDRLLHQVAEDRSAQEDSGVVEIDTRSAQRKRAAAPVEGAVRFWADAKSVVRVVLRRRGERLEMLHRPDAQSGWRHLLRVDAETSTQEWVPLGFGDQLQRFYVRGPYQGRQAVLRLNLADEAAAPELVSDAPEIAQANWLIRRAPDGAAVGVSDGEQQFFWADRLAALQAGLRSAMPGSNPWVLDWRGDRYLLHTEGFDEPARYWLGTRSQGQLDPLLSTWPGLPERLPMSRQRMNLGGGGQIEVFLPAEPAAGSLPLVWCSPCALSGAGDRGVFRPLIPWLLGQGWAVAVPSGLQHSGGTNQGFIESAAELRGVQLKALGLVLERGLFDRQRVLLLSQYFNAYALLDGNAPSPFAAALVVATPSDLGDLANRAILDHYGSAMRREARIGFGDYSTLQLYRHSLTQQVERLPSRMVLVHPARDARLAPSHSRDLAKALREAGKPVQLLEIADVSQVPVHGPQRAEVLRALQELLAAMK